MNKVDFFEIIISLLLGIIMVFLLYNIKRNHNDIFYIKLSCLNLIISIVLFFIISIIESKEIHPAFFIFPLLFFIIVIGILTEYNKIDKETLYTKNGIFCKEKTIKINEIEKITLRNSMRMEIFVYSIVLKDKTNIEIRAEIENERYFFDRLLEINNNIELNLENRFEFIDFLGNLLGIIISLVFYTMTFYKIFERLI